MKIEAVFGGILFLLVIAMGAFAMLGADLGPRGGGLAPTTSVASSRASAEPVCQCFDAGFDLAGRGLGVMSSEYRTGFEQCRAQLGPVGGDAWTAGWNARLSAKPYEASCRNWRKRAA